MLKPSDIWPTAQLRKHALCSFLQPHIISSPYLPLFPSQPALNVLNHPQSTALLYRDRTDCIRQIIKLRCIMSVLLDSRQENKAHHKVSVIHIMRKRLYIYIYIYKKKVKWSRYRPGVAQRVGRGIALLFHDRGTRRGWVVSSTPRPHLNPGKDPVPIVQVYMYIYMYIWFFCNIK